MLKTTPTSMVIKFSNIRTRLIKLKVGVANLVGMAQEVDKTRSSMTPMYQSVTMTTAVMATLE